jgi:hypothetical protein
VISRQRALDRLEHFQAKWIPVRVKEMRENKILKATSKNTASGWPANQFQALNLICKPMGIPKSQMNVNTP